MKSFIILLLVAAVTAEEINCGINAHFETCGSYCPPTCGDLEGPPKACPAVCVKGCQCDEGFVRASGGRCVKPENCPRNRTDDCPANSHYTECGTACPTTCKNYKSPPKACSFICISGCFCDVGYVQTEDGKCIKPERCAAERKNCVDKPDSGICCGHFPMWYYDEDANDCKKFTYGGCWGNGNRYATKEQCLKMCAPEVCGVNERYNRCGTTCPTTCDNYDIPPRICNKLCKTGCECEKGFVRRADGKCVRPDQCPNRQVKCGINAHFTTCGSSCPPTCGDLDDSSKVCAAVCVVGCQCDKGFVRASGGCCVKPENCPRNQTYPDKNCVDGMDAGPCRALFPSWYYNKETGNCEHFIYGGCKGNGNRYDSEEECIDNCVGE